MSIHRAVVFWLAACLALTGCVSVPLTTIVRMSTFDERDFVALDPDEIRANIKLEDGYVLDAPRSALGVAIKSDAGAHEGEFKLEQVTSQRTELSKGALAADVPGIEYVLRLSAASKAEFRKLQAFVGRGRPGEVIITIVPILSAYPADAPFANVWVDLQLRKSQGYFTLLKAAEVPMDAIRAASAAAK